MSKLRAVADAAKETSQQAGEAAAAATRKAEGAVLAAAAAKQKVKLEEGATADKPMKVANKSASPREQLKTFSQATKPKVESSSVPPPKW